MFGCRKDEGREGLAGAEGALLPSTDRTGRCPQPTGLGEAANDSGSELYMHLW